jgi:hypothetical protein
MSITQSSEFNPSGQGLFGSRTGAAAISASSLLASDRLRRTAGDNASLMVADSQSLALLQGTGSEADALLARSTIESWR